jgi:Ankyrin repeats (many copies)
MSNSMETFLSAILDDDQPRVRQLLKSDPGLATSLVDRARLYESKIVHWIYVGDTALHLAAAGHRAELVRLLLAAGADPNATTNHRQSGPLHYASDGYINGPDWNANRQVETLQILLDAAARINAQDKNGATPLHRAARTRCAAAVKYLLQRGSDATRRNQPGSTPFHLAVQDTGRGGAGTDAARAAQREIIHTFLSLGLSPSLKDGKGKSVLDCARSSWIRILLSENAPQFGSST